MGKSHGQERIEGTGRPDDPTYHRSKFYTGGTDANGHSGKAYEVKVVPWLKDLMVRIANEIPAYNGQLVSMYRNYFTHGVHHDIQLIEDPKLREQLMKEFQLHADMEEQSRQVQRFAEMQRYVNSTRTALALYAETGNWMMVSRETERMKKNLDDGVLWEPCVSEIQGLVDEYTKKLQEAKK